MGAPESEGLASREVVLTVAQPGKPAPGHRILVNISLVSVAVLVRDTMAEGVEEMWVPRIWHHSTLPQLAGLAA